MIARRTVTFGSLALAALPAVARAGEEQELPETLKARIVLTRRGSELLVDVGVRNDGPETFALLVANGSQPGGEARAFLQVEGEDIELAAIREIDRREVLTRAGPRPRFLPLASGKELSTGVHRFSLPQGVEEERVAVEGWVATMEGTLRFRQEGLRWRTPKV